MRKFLAGIILITACGAPQAEQDPKFIEAEKRDPYVESVASPDQDGYPESPPPLTVPSPTPKPVVKKATPVKKLPKKHKGKKK